MEGTTSTSSSSFGSATSPQPYLQSSLENLQSRGSRNILKTLRHRELGGCYPQASVLGKISIETFDTLLLRQLLLARSTGMKRGQTGDDSSEHGDSRKRRRKNSEGFPVIRITANSRTSERGQVPKHLFWVNERIFAYVGDRYICYKCENGILKKKYQIKSAQKWKAWDTWYHPDHPIPGFNRTIGALLCTLSGNAVNLYFLDTGKRYYKEIKLDGNTKFSELIPSEEMGKLVIPCMKASLHPDLHFDGILLDVLDPLKSVRLQIKKIATGKRQVENVACYDNLLQFNFRDCVQIWDLTKILSSSSVDYEVPEPNGQERISVVVISQLRAPFILFHLKKTRGFRLGLYPLPLQFINDGSVYDMITQDLLPVMDNQASTLSELQFQTLLTEEVDGSVNFHSDGTSRVIFCSKNIFCGASIQPIENIAGDCQGSELVQEVYMKFDMQRATSSGTPTTPVPIQVSPSRRSSRVRSNPVKYAYDEDEDEESNVRITYFMANHIDALVIMEVASDPPNFKFHFYDSKSWNKLFSIVPKCEPERKIPPEELSTFTFNVAEAEIIFGSIGKTTDTVFVVSLLDEVVYPEDRHNPTNLPPSFKYPKWIRSGDTT